MKSGLTLIEVLAAVSLLSMVAAVAIPVTMDVGRKSLQQADAREALAVISDLTRNGIPQPGVLWDRAPHGWWIQVVPLRRAGATEQAAPVYQWMSIQVGRGALDQPEILAERLLVIFPGGG